MTQMLVRLTRWLHIGAAALGLALVCVAAIDGSQTAGAAPAATTPTLTVEQKQAVQILAQRIELAQLRAQAAETEFERAKGELSTLLRGLQKDGYDLNLQIMEYVKKPEPPKAPEKKDESK